ncbi:MAG: hypothetical protein FDZ69_12045 [Deltaproteobacteria bacterium]|nr:MAG: hypothetical protein FDZ69_12045 [Deltaproteobacteria bacterium]
MNISARHKNIVRAILFTAAAGLYALEGILLNPLILWTALPIYIGYSTLAKSWRIGSIRKACQGYGFLTVSLGFSYFYHFAWFFDWGGTKTGCSTSAIIFIWFPIYAVILGGIGYLVGSVVTDE